MNRQKTIFFLLAGCLIGTPLFADVSQDKAVANEIKRLTSAFSRAKWLKHAADEEQAGMSLLKYADSLNEKTKTNLFSRLTWLVCKSKNKAALDALSLRQDLPEEMAFELALLQKLRTAKADQVAEMFNAFPRWKTIAPAVQLETLNRLATYLLLLNHDASAQKVLELAEKMKVPFQRKRIFMKSVEVAPPGAGGWIMSEAWQSGGAQDFTPYSRQAQANIVWDAVIERQEIKNANIAPYLNDTRFHFLYDEEGLHLFVVCGEKELEKYRLQNSGAGALEIFISPGMEKKWYHQFYIDLPSGEIKYFFAIRSYRPISDYAKSETICRDGKMGTYLFIPWVYFYDVLPFETGENWRFNVVRWTPAGGITWSGRTHELTRMGELVWGEKNPALERKIRQRIADYAVAKYQKAAKDLRERWNDPELGDPAFGEKVLAGALKKWDDAIANAQAEKKDLSRELVAELMEIDLCVQGLRKEYLTKKFHQAK